MKSSTQIFVSYYLFIIFKLANCCCNEGIGDNDHRSCIISTNQHDFNERQPIIFQVKTTPEIVYPDVVNPTLIKIKIGEAQYRVMCPSNFLTVKSINQDVGSDFLVCLNGTALRLTHSQNEILSFKEIVCAREAIPTVRMNRYGAMEIGFQLNILDFLPIIRSIIIDTETLQILMAYVKIVPVIANRQIGRGAWSFRKGAVFQNLPINISEIYKRDYQRIRFMRIFNDPLIVDKYLSKIGDTYLTGSQLVSERDLFYRTQQAAASFHENIVPIWQSVATGNWELVGEFVRKLAADSSKGLHVWSGSIDILELPDFRGCLRKIFLVEDGMQGRQMIPVPKLLYKYVYDGYRHRGLVFVTVNDPHLVYGITNDLLLCQEQRICQELNPHFINVRRGFTYCCSLQSFSRVARALRLPIFPNAASLHTYF